MWLIGRKGLFFGLSLGANRCLKRQACSVLSGDMFDRSVAGARSLCLSRGSAFQSEDHLSNFDLLAFFYLDLFDNPADRRRHFDHGLVRFQLHHRLPFGNLGAGGDHQTHQIALRNVFSEFGEFEFAGPGPGGRRGRSGGRRRRRFGAEEEGAEVTPVEPAQPLASCYRRERTLGLLSRFWQKPLHRLRWPPLRPR